ncbi:hypothetical protein Scep_030490 [Stephania cephalantha]|uniref:Disease resistance R13L4/SHOC-2-like LRR domain-containing protein n=1 Tax=Stephania cephalantha TaxID=152367 RepID=A0AAP0DZQ6_9MAGN
MNYDDDVSVIPILGMCGVGKTILASLSAKMRERSNFSETAVIASKGSDAEQISTARCLSVEGLRCCADLQSGVRSQQQRDRIVTTTIETPEIFSNLRYLGLSRNPKITSLPESIGGLERLETLKVVSCSRLESLPVQLCNLPSLKSLSIDACAGLASLPHALSRLTSLQTLRISSCPYLRSLPVMGMQGRKSNLRSLHRDLLRWRRPGS